MTAGRRCLWPCRPFELNVPWALVLKLLLPESATVWQHFPISGYCWTRLFKLWVWNVPEQTPTGLSRYFLPIIFHPHCLTKPQTFDSSLQRALSLSWTPLRKESGGRNPTTGSPGGQISFQSSSSPRVHHPLGTLGVVWLGRASLGPETVLHPEGTSATGPAVRSLVAQSRRTLRPRGL